MSEDKIIPRLCGGTFFTLLLPARKDIKKSQNNFLRALMALYDPAVGGVTVDSFKTPGSQFKNCNQTYKSENIRIGDAGVRRLFEDRFENKYDVLLADAEKMCKDYLQVGATSQSALFVKDVLEVITNDDSIEDDEDFFINFDGSSVKKKDLLELEYLYFPSTVLGIWYFICTKRTDNSVGEATIAAWNKKPFEGTKGFLPKLRVGFEKINQFNGDTLPLLNVNSDKEGLDMGDPDPWHPSVVSRVLRNMNGTAEGLRFRYVINAQESFKKSKSFFYPNEEREFYEFYVCNELTSREDMIFYDGGGHVHNPDKNLKNVTAKELVNKGRYAVIVGTGGLGKSMMMKHLMLDALKVYSDEQVIPAFVVLKDYNPDDASLLDYIFSQIEQYNMDMTLSDFLEWMKQGSVLFLLDGLDEVKAKYRNKFDNELNKLTEKYQTCAFVMSSRPIGSFGEFKHFKVYELQPFTKKQAIDAITKLDFRVYDESIKRDFIEELDKRLYREKMEFAGNPLLLTIMMITFEQYHEIPTQKFLFYEKAYEALTQKHDATKSLTREYATRLDPYEFKKYFSEFCLYTYHDEQYRFTREQLEQAFQVVIELNNLNTTPAAFITDASDKICLLYRDGDSYIFCHRSFQEYFAAYFCSRQIEERFHFIREMFNDKDDNAFDDEALGMLYGMDEQKTEVQIIIPFLDRIFKTGDDYKDYIEFLRWVYPVIEFENGETDGWVESSCNSAQFIFIANQYGFKYDIDGDAIECDYNMAAEIFAYIDDNWDKPDAESNMRLVNVDSIPEGYKRRIGEDEYEDVENIEYVGMRVRIEISFIYGDSKYKNLYNKEKAILEDDSFAPHREFYAAKELLEKLKEKYQKKRNTNWITNFH